MDVLEAFRNRNGDRVRATKIVTDVAKGVPERDAYIHYLVNVYHYARHSPRVIALAASRCAETASDLARYLLHHAGEELGHEEWARDDLLALGVGETQLARSRPVPACASMIGYEYFLAGQANPVSLLGWLFALESLGDDVADSAADGFNRGLKLDGKGTYFLRAHGEADHSHSRDLIGQIGGLTSPTDLADVLEAAEVSSVLYARMLDEIVAPGASPWR